MGCSLFSDFFSEAYVFDIALSSKKCVKSLDILFCVVVEREYPAACFLVCLSEAWHCRSKFENDESARGEGGVAGSLLLYYPPLVLHAPRILYLDFV